MKARKKPRYSTGDAELDAKLDELVSSTCPGREKEYVLQIATSALKLGKEKALQHLIENYPTGIH